MFFLNIIEKYVTAQQICDESLSVSYDAYRIMELTIPFLRKLIRP